MKLKIREELPGHEKHNDRDPLDLLQVGTYAFIDPDSTRDDPTYQWVKPSELDTAAGVADPQFVQRAQELGLEIDLDATNSPVGGDEFDALVRGRSPSPTPPSTKRQRTAPETISLTEDEEEDGGNDDNNDDNNDDDDDGDDDSTSGGAPTTARTSATGSEAGPDASHFSAEEIFDHATQDDDHGARQQHDSTVTKQFSRRKKRGGEVDMESLAQSMSSMSVNDDQQSSSSDLPYGYGYGHGYDSTYSQGGSESSGYGAGYGQGAPPSDHGYDHGGFAYGYGYGYGYGGYTYGGASYGESQMYPGHGYSSSQRAIAYGNYPPMGPLANMDANTYLTYRNEYIALFQRSMTWEQYCDYVQRTYQGGHNSSTSEEPARNSFWY